jgi:hypothetical protein
MGVHDFEQLRHYLFSGVTDPSVVPVNARQGALYLRFSESTSAPLQVYIKRDNGLSTNWGIYLATLDEFGHLPASQLTVSAMEYQGSWNALTNSPTLIDGTGSSGDTYRVTTAGTRNLGSGQVTYLLGDLVIYNGTIWERIEASQPQRQQSRYVDMLGNNTTGDGSFEKPFLTIEAAENSITDASPTNLYVVVVGAGIYAEGSSTIFRDNIILRGAGRDVTSITGNITYTYGGASGTMHAIQDIKVANVTYNPSTIAAGSNRNTNFNAVIFNSYVGTVVFNGDGTIKSNGPGLQVYESQIGALTVNGGVSNNIFRSSITPGVTVTNVPFLSSGNFLNSTVISRDTIGNTITTQSGLAYPVDGTTTGTLGGGRIRVWTGSSGPSLSSGFGFQRALFTYTAYNPSTGVFSGLTINAGTLAAITAGDVMTNEESSSVQIFHSRNSGGVTVTGVGSNSQANGVFRGNIQGVATVSGGNSLYTVDTISMGTSATPVTYLNGALSTFNLFYTSGARGINYNPITSANWPTASVVAAGDVTINNKTISNFASTTDIFEGATVSGTGIPTGSLVVSLTSSTVTIDQNPTATNAGVSITFQNVVPKSVQVAIDILSRRKANVAGTLDGQVQFKFGGVLAASTHLTWDNTNERLVIGKLGENPAGPEPSLTIFGDMSANPQLRLGTSSSADFYWDLGRENAATGDFLFMNANGGGSTEKFRISIAGNLTAVGKATCTSFVSTSAVNTLRFLAGTNPTDNPITVGGVGSVWSTYNVSDDASGSQRLDVFRSIRYSNFTGDTTAITLARARGTFAAPLLVSSASGGDSLGLLNFLGFDGTEWEQAAQIEVIADPVPGVDSMPARMVFRTTPTGSATPLDRFTIGSNGALSGAGTATFSNLSGSNTGDQDLGVTPSANIANVNNAASPYTILSADQLIFVDTSGGVVSLNLPNPALRRTWVIKDRAGSLSTNSLTLVRFGAESIENVAANKVFSTNFGSWRIASDGTNYWIIG